MTISIILAFLFGIAVGSFLNVVSLRFNTGFTLGGRSKCMSCGKILTWKELIPLFSFIFLKGSCLKCKSRISRQYPLVEFAAGIIFVLVFLYFPPLTPLASLTTLIYVIMTCLLLVITVYDIKHKIIPDPFVYSFCILAFVGLFFGGSDWAHVPEWSTILAGPILALPFTLLWLVSKGKWIGLGDAKLSLGIGWILGLYGGVNALILGIWIAAVVSVLWFALVKRNLKPKTEVPFGPYLILGMYLVLFFNFQVLDLALARDIVMSL
jgi:prepilin signal peptidase PulO-like enzyme (type II secretory pathway)